MHDGVLISIDEEGRAFCGGLDMAGLALMRELLRGDVVRELVYTGRIVNGAGAVTLGLAPWGGCRPSCTCT